MLDLQVRVRGCFRAHAQLEVRLQGTPSWIVIAVGLAAGMIVMVIKEYSGHVDVH